MSKGRIRSVLRSAQAVTLVSALWLAAHVAPAAAQTLPVGQTLTFMGQGGTDTKPESKCFDAQGSWWCALFDGTHTYLWRFDGKSTWTKETVPGIVDTSSGRADCLSIGSTLYISINTGSTIKIYKFAWDAINDQYVKASGWSTPVTLSIGAGSAVITRDSTGRLWLAADVASSTQIVVYYTTTNDRTWSGPFMLDGVVKADISSIVSFGGNKVGVFWSNHVQDNFKFQVHLDSAPPTTWQPVEIVEQGPIGGKPLADNHVNMTAAADGRVFVAAKTSFDTTGTDNLVLYVRGASGGWSPRVPINVWGSPVATRPIVKLDPTNNTVYTFFTNTNNSSTGGIIEYRTSDMTNLAFGTSTTFIGYSGSRFNDASSAKNNFTPSSGALVVSKDQISNTAYYNYQLLFGITPPDTTPPAAPVGLAVAVASGVTLTWTANTEPDLAGYNVYRSIVSGGPYAKLNAALVTNTTYSDAPDGTGPYYYVVTAVDTSNNESLRSAQVSTGLLVDTTPPAAPVGLSAAQGGSPNTALLLHFDEGSGGTTQDSSGQGLTATLAPPPKAPAWQTNGRFGAGLLFTARKPLEEEDSR